MIFTSRDGFRTPAYAALLLALWPAAACANSGTPLMLASFSHLLFGNFLLGVGEGMLIALVFRLPKLKTMALLIAANYVSAWLGHYLLGGRSLYDLQPYTYLARYLPMTLDTAWTSLWILIGAAYLLTLVLEFPFIAFAMRRLPRWLPKAILATLVVQTVSYALLIGWYSEVSRTSMLTEAELVDLSEIPLPENVLLYYISAEDGDLYARPLDEDEAERVYDLNKDGEQGALALRRDSEEDTTWDLAEAYGPRATRSFVTIRENIGIAAKPDARPLEGTPQYFVLYGEAWDIPKLGAAESSPWEFHGGGWHMGGIFWNYPEDGEHFRLAFETPFADWSVRYATHLPGDLLLFELDRDQIMVYDPATRKLARVTEGRVPLPVIPQEAD